MTNRTGINQAFAYGFLTQILNPEAIVFFTALLPQFVTVQANLAMQFALLASFEILSD